MIRLASVLLLSLACFTPAYSQVVMGNQVPKVEIDKAKKLVTDSATNKIVLGVDEFEILVTDPKIEVPLQWQYEDVIGITFEEVAANEGYSFHGKRVGDKEAKRHKFPARPTPWIIAYWSGGNARATVFLNKNGDDAKKIGPIGIDKRVIEALGGVPVPDPDKPPLVIDTELTKQLRAAYTQDVVSGKAQNGKVIAQQLSDVYASLSRTATLDRAKTVGMLNTTIGTAIEGMGIPAPETSLTQVRTVIMNYILQKLNATLTSTNEPMTDARLAAAKAAFAELATSLEAVSK